MRSSFLRCDALFNNLELSPEEIGRQVALLVELARAVEPTISIADRYCLMYRILPDFYRTAKRICVRFEVSIAQVSTDQNENPVLANYSPFIRRWMSPEGFHGTATSAPDDDITIAATEIAEGLPLLY